MLAPLREEQAPEAISFQGRGNKHGEEWHHARTDDQKIETADDKMLCPDGIYLWFPKENINDGQKKNTIPQCYLILHENLRCTDSMVHIV